MFFVILSGILLTISVAADGSASCWPSSLVKQSDFPFCRVMDQNYALHWSINHKAITMGIYVLGANKARKIHLPCMHHI